MLLTHFELDGATPETLVSFDYTLNLDGSRASVEQVFAADFVGEAEDLVTLIEWEYDAANRLVQETYTTNYDPTIDFLTTYTYDLVGNRVEMATTSDGVTDGKHGPNTKRRGSAEPLDVDGPADDLGSQNDSECASSEVHDRLSI